MIIKLKCLIFETIKQFLGFDSKKDIQSKTLTVMNQIAQSMGIDTAATELNSAAKSKNAASTAAVTAANKAEEESIEGVIAAKLQEQLVQNGLNAEDAKELASNMAKIIANKAEEESIEEVTEEVLEEIVAKELLTIENGKLISIQSGLTAANMAEKLSWDVLTTSIGSALSALWTFLTTTSAGGWVLFAGVIAGIAAAFKLAETSVKEYEEQLKDSKQEYSDIKSEVESLNNELKITNEQIKELESKGDNLSLSDQEDLDRLQAENKELEIRLKYLREEKELKAQEVSDNAVGVYKGKYEASTSKDDVQNVRNNVETDNESWKIDTVYSNDKEMDTIAEQVAAYQYFSEKKKEIINDETLAQEEKVLALEACNEGLKKSELRLIETRKEVQDLYDDASLYGDSETIESMKNDLDLIDQTVLSASENLTNFFNSNIDSSVTKSLVELAESGELTAEVLETRFAGVNKYLEENGLTIEDLISYLKIYKNELEDIDKIIDSTGNKTVDSRMKMINNFNNLSEGFESLDKIWESIKDDDPFDFKLLDDENFKNTFKDCGTVYADFIEQVTDTPNDINACKDAFNDLINTWIGEKRVLDDLDESNKKVTIGLLEQAGITNATEVVERRLAAQKYSTAKAADFLSESNRTEADSFLNNAKSAGVAQSELAKLELQKIQVNHAQINTAGDIRQIIALANAAGASAIQLDQLKRAMNALSKGTGFLSSDFVGPLSIGQQTAKDLINGTYKFDYKPLDADDFIYGGGYSSNKGSGSGSGSSAKDEASEFFDWLERRIKKFQEAFDKWISRAEQAITKGFINYYYNQASKQLSNLMNAQAEAYSYYLQKANAVNLSDSYKKKVREGSISIQEITDEKVKEAISKYQEYYDKATEALTAFEEAADQFYNIPLDALAKRIELFSDAIDILEAKIDNAIGSINKNKLIDQQISKQADILSASNFAKLNAEKNLEEAKKQLNTSANLKGLSDANKKDVQDRIKVGNQVNLALFTEGSDAWKAAVRYNEALQANTEATNEYNKSLQETIALERELAKAKFDNIAQDYERKIEMLNHGVTALDNKIAEAEARGQAVSIDYYKEQIKIEEQKKAILLEEQEALEKQLETIPKGTDEWYDAYATLQDVSSAISECTQNTYELNKAINEATFALFDNIHSEIDRLMDEQEFLRSMMAHEKRVDDDGNFTEAGYANLASLTASLEASKHNAANDKAMVERLDKMIESGELSDGELTFNSLEELEAKREEYYDKWRDDIKETYSLQQEIFDAMKEQYQAEIDAMQELIDTKKEALQAEKELYEYQKSIAEKTKNISKIQKQMAAYQGDTSQEGRAKLQRLQVQLEEAQEDLKDAEMQKAFDDQNQLLDDLAEEFQELIDKKLEDFMGVVQEGMGEANANSATANEYLSGLQESIGYTSESGSLISSTDTISNQVSTIIGQLTAIEESISGLNSVDDEDTSDITTAPAPTTPGNTTSDLSQSTQDKLKEDASNVTASPGADKPSTSSSNSSGSSSGSSSSNSKPKVSSIKSTLKEGSKGTDVKTLQKALNMHQNAKLDVDGIFGTKTKKAVKTFQKNEKIDADGIVGKNTKAKFKKHGYATGSKYIPYDEIAWTQEKGQELIYSRSQNAMLTPLGKGDKVFTNEMTNKLWELAQGELPEVPMKYLNLSDISGKITKYVSKFEGAYGDNIVNVQCAFPNITDGAKAQDMIREIQRSPKLQQALQDVTINRVVPNNRSGRLSVNTIK